MEHVPVFGSTTGSVRSTSPNVQTTLAQPVLGVQQSQTTAFVQPTQQQSVPPAEPASQEPASANVMMEATPSTSQMERPSTSTAVFGTGDLSHELNLICVERALTGAASLSCSNTRCVRGCASVLMISDSCFYYRCWNSARTVTRRFLCSLGHTWQYLDQASSRGGVREHYSGAGASGGAH